MSPSPIIMILTGLCGVAHGLRYPFCSTAHGSWPTSVYTLRQGHFRSNLPAFAALHLSPSCVSVLLQHNGPLLLSSPAIPPTNVRAVSPRYAALNQIAQRIGDRSTPRVLPLLTSTSGARLRRLYPGIGEFEALHCPTTCSPVQIPGVPAFPCGMPPRQSHLRI